MDPHAGKIVLNGAPSQYDRLLETPDVEVDGRSFAELLDFAVRYGGLINFYDLADEIDGDWVPFFLTDPTMALAAMESAEVAAREESFDGLVRRTKRARSFDRKFDLLRQVFASIQGLARQMDGWLRGLEYCPDNEAVRLGREELTAAIENGLGEELRRLKGWDEGAAGPLGQPIGLDWSGFLPVWDLRCARPDGAIYKGSTGNRKIQHALPHLEKVYHAFADAIPDFQSFARTNLPATLDTGRHKPHIALYIAFVMLFRTAQETINTISARLERFYYRDVLREPLLPAIPDSVYVTFALAEEEGLTSTTVPKPTLFPAGQEPDGREILYAADRDLTVTSAVLGKLRTLRKTEEMLLSSEISTEAAVAGNSSWATFGETVPGATETEVTEPATLGFALASNYLLLTGGERCVKIGVTCAAASWAALEAKIAEIADATGLDPSAVLAQVLKQAFEMYVSTAGGWFRLEGHNAETAAQGFDLRFKLTPTAPAVVPYDPESEAAAEAGDTPVSEDPRITATNPDPKLPTLKSYLRQEPVILVGERGTAEVFPFSLLDGLEVADTRISTHVRGLSGLTLQNTDGDIDPSSPFTVFGGVPVVGSYLEIRHPEIFAKTPKTLKTGLKWFGLPPNDNGFKGWYRDYVINLNGEPEPDLFDNAVFRGAISVREPGPWSLGDSGRDLYLFRTKPDCSVQKPTPDGALCNETVFDTLQVSSPPTPPPYYDPAASALRLELTKPCYAFGNDLYAANVLNAVIQDLPDTEGCQKKCVLEGIAFSEAATALQAGLDHCVDADPYLECIQTYVDQAVGILVQAFYDCVLRTLSQCQCKGDPCAKVLDVLIGSLKMCMSLPPSGRAGCMKSCLDENREALPCIARCLPYLQKALKIEVAVTKCNGDKACLQQALAERVARLQAAYAARVEACMKRCMKLKNELRYPNEPYLPQAEAVWLDYTAEGDGRLFQLLPFGGFLESGPGPLLPVFADPGNLYIAFSGFPGIVPPQTLTLLFQMTADRRDDLSGEPPAVQWSYLSRNAWTGLKTSQVLADGTGGFQSSGILALSLPAFDPAGNTVLSNDFQWLRASVAENPDRFPDTAGLWPHALVATWQDDGGGTAEHLRQPLPAHTITGSVQDLGQIGAIDQPLESFGGRPPETEDTYGIRLSERLRHKDRGSLAWDYERLVLERFPTVWKTAVLPAWSGPGNVVVVVVPGAESQQAQDPTVPRASSDLLHQIETYLAERISPFIRLRAANPQYVRIKVAAKVFFRDGEGSNIDRLNEDLIQYLSPWFYDAAREATDGRYAMEDDISEFVQNRPYVEALQEIGFAYDPPEKPDWYFLTSAAEHDIQEATGGRC